LAKTHFSAKDYPEKWQALIFDYLINVEFTINIISKVLYLQLLNTVQHCLLPIEFSVFSYRNLYFKIILGYYFSIQKKGIIKKE